jgi:hypothetical protein
MIGNWNLDDLANPPDITGLWEADTRFMYDRNRNDGVKFGVREVAPPDPQAPNGRLVQRISKSGPSFTGQGQNAAAHDHSLRLIYIGGNRFFGFVERKTIADQSTMVMHSVVTLRADGLLETMVVHTEGGNPALRDPPPSYRELRTWRRVAKRPRRITKSAAKNRALKTRKR